MTITRSWTTAPSGTVTVEPGAVRAAARRHGLEFWNIVLSVAHFRYAEVSGAGFRFQVYTTLA